MVMHRDLMMRMIEKLSQAFFQILAGKGVDDPEQSILNVEDLLSEALGTPREFVLGQGPAAIETLESPLAAEVGRLLMLHADLCEETGDPGKARQARKMGLYALRRAMDRPSAEFATMSAGVLREYVDVLSTVVDRATLADACIDAHEVARLDDRWDDAEDWLFWALELEPHRRHVETGYAFYDTLDDLDDESLREGGLSRSEVEDARQELAAF